MNNFCRFAKEPGDKILIKSFFVEIIFFAVHSAAFFFYVLGKNASIRSELPTAVCWYREKREEGVNSTCYMSKASQIIRSFARWGVNFDRWVKLSARWGKWFEHWVTIVRWGERKACNHIVLWILISLLQCDQIIILTVMRFTWKVWHWNKVHLQLMTHTLLVTAVSLNSKIHCIKFSLLLVLFKLKG